MAISRANAPTDGEDSAVAYLSELLPRWSPGGGGVKTLGLAQPARTASAISEPLPIYLVAVDDIDGPDFLAHAKLTGWRYFVTGGDADAVADIESNQLGKSQFSRLTKGRFATRLAAAANLAEKQFGSGPESFEPRILEIPGLYQVAIWLHGFPRDAFVVAIDGARPQAPIEIDDKFVDRIVALARAKRGAPLRAS